MKIKHTAAATYLERSERNDVVGEERLTYVIEAEYYFDWDIRRFPNGNIM